ncbi:MAG: Tyrosine-tRNA ligase [Candidatus Nomurabacteria bacterium GW2011_GWF2_43_8]|uniref:Tyrosine--tRNA ligase n=3 Tax=Candidatus Nomuraibacteriota TaxID=1752729 RepID=A0A0G1FJ27_9BACT|nr:MAG: Tyrosine-tRNA ligase [Candidatus Nomurabacteria bacterium GW2011_GWA2_43_15]KKT18965.1 MAG: Tyrosine-tRNA ligase [Candidatus Nomurabacteria bacterium GW2011_GWB1_43_7]KKT22008.1 MAG: Tyrosine-tRNA ligase [Candidatus Nomurabacteria bacterium GW2011_GWF2_43_8]
MKVVTDEKKIDEVLARGVENIFVREELKKKLLSGKKLKVYLGIDPTGPTLHMGHAIPLQKLKQFQELGHQVILLMGDFTAMVGDPTDKMAARKRLSRREVLDNLKKYKKQASVFLKFTGDNKAEFKFNSKWLSRMTFEDVLNLTSRATVDQMLKRDMFARRNTEGKPIFIHEFLYPLMQGYDSVAMGVDVEVGGNDQTFNMLVGRNLVFQMLGKNKSVLAMKLLEDNAGKKMGKTEGNMITFEDDPNEMFGKVMSWADSLIGKGFELCTEIDLSGIKAGQNPRDLKMKLAFEIVKIYHGEKQAQKAEESFVKTFQKKEIPEAVEEVEGGEPLNKILLRVRISKSNSEVYRLLKAGAIMDLTENKKVFSPKIVIKGHIYKIGKHRFIKIK